MEEEKLEEEAKIKEIEEKFEQERREAEAKQQAEKEEQERKIRKLEEKLKNEQAEDEIKKAEEQKRAIEEEVRKREEEARISELKAKEEVEEQKRLLEKKRKEHNMLDETLNTLLPMVKEANISAEELKRKILFEPTIVHEVSETPGQSPLEELKNSKSKVKVKIMNKEDGTQYLWDPEKFSDRLYMIRDVLNDYFDTGKMPKLEKEEDPFWDPEEAHLIGKAYLYLKSLGYMLDNKTVCKIMNTNTSGDLGTLTVGVIPTDESGEADMCPEELEVDNPSELIGKSIDVNIVIEKASGLPENLCKDTYVKYSWYLGNEDYGTEIIEGVNNCPEYGYKYHLRIDCVTEDLLKYFEKDAISFRVYGNPTSAKFKKQLTLKNNAKKADAKKSKEERKEGNIAQGSSNTKKNSTKKEEESKEAIIKNHNGRGGDTKNRTGC